MVQKLCIDHDNHSVRHLDKDPGLCKKKKRCIIIINFVCMVYLMESADSEIWI